jgi:hypothetical protein
MDNNESESPTIMEMEYKQKQNTYNESEINLHNFGFQDMQINNVYNMRKLKMIEGDERFFLRTLINAYNYLKYSEKILISVNDFNTLNNNLKNITFHTKKSPIGLLLAIYIYDKNKIINKEKFYKIFKVKENIKIDANTIVPINYIYKTYANDLIRYVKLLHKILK